MKSFLSYLREVFEKPKNIPDVHPDMIVPENAQDPEKYLSGGWKERLSANYMHTFTHPVTGQEHTIETNILGLPYHNAAIVGFKVDHFYTNYQNRISDPLIASHIAKVVHGHVAHYVHHSGIDKLHFSVIPTEKRKEERTNLYGRLARKLGVKAFVYADGKSTEVT